MIVKIEQVATPWHLKTDGSDKLDESSVYLLLFWYKLVLIKIKKIRYQLYIDIKNIMKAVIYEFCSIHSYRRLVVSRSNLL